MDEGGADAVHILRYAACIGVLVEVFAFVPGILSVGWYRRHLAFDFRRIFHFELLDNFLNLVHALFGLSRVRVAGPRILKHLDGFFSLFLHIAVAAVATPLQPLFNDCTRVPGRISRQLVVKPGHPHHRPKLGQSLIEPIQTLQTYRLTITQRQKVKSQKKALSKTYLAKYAESVAGKNNL